MIVLTVAIVATITHQWSVKPTEDGPRDALSRPLSAKRRLFSVAASPGSRSANQPNRTPSRHRSQPSKWNGPHSAHRQPTMPVGLLARLMMIVSNGRYKSPTCCFVCLLPFTTDAIDAIDVIAAIAAIAAIDTIAAVPLAATLAVPTTHNDHIIMPYNKQQYNRY